MPIFNVLKVANFSLNLIISSFN